jgi:hypothetical protein
MLSRKRAGRYDLRAPVRYRAAGETSWNEGFTLNVSDSGVLIAGELPVLEPVTVIVLLPSSSGCLAAAGRIARVTNTATSATGSTFAIAVPQFRIKRQSAVER